MLVGDAVRLLFPQGNLDWWVDLKSKMENKEAFGPKGDQYGPWYLPPVDPIDLFAITAFLLSRSGAYHHIQPETHQGPPAEFRKLEVTLSDRQHWVEIGRAWAQATVRQDVSGDKVTLETPEAVGQMWSRIWPHSMNLSSTPWTREQSLLVGGGTQWASWLSLMKQRPMSDSWPMRNCRRPRLRF